jgi:NAD(P)-dependent dehydrogenase (short-subunit alcohol dehydrogenase family)
MKASPARSVFVTGSSSGIGRACVLDLDARGWRVFAGVRNEADGQDLQRSGSERITPIRLDVTIEEQIAAAVRAIADSVGDRGLDALVNNAGIAVAGPLEFISLADFRKQLEVNVTGALAVPQAMLGLLRRARGRIVMMSSVSARLALPFVGPYAASKFALEALADSLRLELRPHGVTVSLVEPGPISTPLMNRSIDTAEERLEQLPPEAMTLYRPLLEAARASALESEKKELAPEAVARVVADALEARRPKTRYVVLRWSRLFRLSANLLPDRLRDEIVWHILTRHRR